MPEMTQDKILADLNAAQREAVCHGPGPQLIVAGAGTGKTAVITRRIAHLVARKACSAREILALTFTDKAAEEMESRVDVLVPYGFTDSTICTFHAFGDRLLREQGVLLGINPDYRILSKSEQRVFLREHLFALPVKHLRPLSDPTRHLELMLDIISRAKDEDVRPAAYRDFCAQRLAGLHGEPEAQQLAAWNKQQEVAAVYARYQELMSERGFVDFGDLILLALDLFRRHPDVLADYRARYRYLLVDEFQDTNAAQFELIQLLAGPAANLTVVGDDDQSIYKFRGAAISNILQFTRHYPQAQVRLLNQNYRSTQTILDTAYRLVRHNDPERLEIKHGLSKRLLSARGEGAAVTYRRFDTVSAEADWAAEEILRQRRQGAGGGWSDFAILVRTNRQADPFLRALNAREIPYRFSGSQGLYRRPEVRLCISFLNVVADPTASMHLHDLAASDLYRLPAEDLAQLAALGQRRHRPLWHVLREAAGEAGSTLRPEAMDSTRRLVADLQNYQELAKRLSTGQLLYHFLSDTGLLAKYTEANTLESDFAIRNLAKFFDLVRRYEKLALSDRVLYFVRHLDLLQAAGDDPPVAEAESEEDSVSVLTVHRAKGLEFDAVFLVGLASQRFPAASRRPALDLPPELAKEDLPTQDSYLAEERRLFYVAMTRAKRGLFLSSAKDYGGVRQYKTSPFVLEALDLPKDSFQTWKASALEQIQTHAPLPGQAILAPRPMGQNEILNLSYYQVDDYRTCPLKYKYIHILKIPILPHHAILYGNAVHLAVQAYYRQVVAGQPRLREEEVVEIFRKSWVSEGFISREHEEMRLEAGMRAIHKLLEVEEINPSKPIYIEKSFNYLLGNNKISGRLDRVDLLPDQRAVIIDFKTSEIAGQKEADAKARGSLQMKIYSSAWLRTEGRLPARVELRFLDSGLIGTAEYPEQEINATEAMIQETADGIRRQDFGAKPSAWTCNYCPYRTICPESAV